MIADDFLGLSKKRAQDVAEYNSFIFRLVKVDDEEMLGYPTDINLERICVEIENGKVVKASIQ